MGKLSEIVGDITEFKGDAIINSVGVQAKIHGGICGSILKKANSPELKTIIDSVDDVYTVGDIFVTDGYGLPAKHIVHVIPPHHKDDNESKVIVKIIRVLLNECQRRELYNIAIPMIGCGANGYDSDGIYGLLKIIGEQYCKQFDKMNITLVKSSEQIGKENSDRLAQNLIAEGIYHNEEGLKKFEKGVDIFTSESEDLTSALILKGIFGFNPKGDKRESVVIKANVKKISDYVSLFIEKLEKIKRVDSKIIRRRLMSYFGYGTASKGTLFNAGVENYKQCTKKVDAKRETFYKIILGLKMTLEEAENFMSYFGRTFAHPDVIKEDDIIRDLVDRQMYGIFDANNEYKKNGLKPLFDIKTKK